MTSTSLAATAISIKHHVRVLLGATDTIFYPPSRPLFESWTPSTSDVFPIHNLTMSYEALGSSARATLDDGNPTSTYMRIEIMDAQRFGVVQTRLVDQRVTTVGSSRAHGRAPTRAYISVTQASLATRLTQ